MGNKVPEIRFKGFSGEWIEHKLQDLTENGFSNGVFNDPQKVGKGYRLINVKDMYSGDCIDVDGLSLVNIDEKEFKNNKVQYGDIFFTRSSLVKEGIAYSNVNLSDRSDLTFDGHLIRMQPCKATTDPVFLASLFKTSYARKQLILGGKTTTMTTIGQSDIAIVELALPSKQEQTAIGNTFQKLDNLINQHQQKHDKLSNIKKAMLEKMFPKQGETIPEIRFKGFSGEWEESVLGAISEITTGKLDANAMIANGKYDFYTSGIKKYRIDIPAFEGPAITVAGNGATVGYMHLADGKFNAYQRTYVLTNFKANRYFLFCNIGKALPSKINQEVRAGNIPYIVLDMLTDLEIKLPSEKDEQAKIGNYFQKLDALINQHQQQINKLNNIKQACLSKMFV